MSVVPDDCPLFTPVLFFSPSVFSCSSLSFSISPSCLLEKNLSSVRPRLKEMIHLRLPKYSVKFVSSCTPLLSGFLPFLWSFQSHPLFCFSSKPSVFSVSTNNAPLHPYHSHTPFSLSLSFSTKLIFLFSSLFSPPTPHPLSSVMCKGYVWIRSNIEKMHIGRNRHLRITWLD